MSSRTTVASGAEDSDIMWSRTRPRSVAPGCIDGGRAQQAPNPHSPIAGPMNPHRNESAVSERATEGHVATETNQAIADTLSALVWVDGDSAPHTPQRPLRAGLCTSSLFEEACCGTSRVCVPLPLYHRFSCAPRGLPSERTSRLNPLVLKWLAWLQPSRDVTAPATVIVGVRWLARASSPIRGPSRTPETQWAQ